LKMQKNGGVAMARDLRSESEFGLPSPMPVFAPDGTVVEGAAIDAAVAAGGLPALTDAEALATGGVAATSAPSADEAASELRRIYATDEDQWGVREPKAGTQ
jgi:hypothetical protein